HETVEHDGVLEARGEPDGARRGSERGQGQGQGEAQRRSEGDAAIGSGHGGTSCPARRRSTRGNRRFRPCCLEGELIAAVGWRPPWAAVSDRNRSGSLPGGRKTPT